MADLADTLSLRLSRQDMLGLASMLLALRRLDPEGAGFVDRVLKRLPLSASDLVALAPKEGARWWL